MSQANAQAPGGDSDKLPNDWPSTSSINVGNSVGPKFSGSGGGNATGPELKNQKGQQGNG